MSKENLDIRGEICPMTVMEALQKVKEMNPGDTLIILSDDPTAAISIPVEMKRRGHIVEKKQLESNECEITVEIK